MPRNTGRGSRAAAQRCPKQESTWIKHDTSTGRFLESKVNGGSFRAAFLEGRKSPLKSRLWDWLTRCRLSTAGTSDG